MSFGRLRMHTSLICQFVYNVGHAGVLDYPDPSELTAVYDTLLEAAFNGRQGMDPRYDFI